MGNFFQLLKGMAQDVSLLSFYLWIINNDQATRLSATKQRV